MRVRYGRRERDLTEDITLPTGCHVGVVQGGQRFVLAQMNWSRASCWDVVVVNPEGATLRVRSWPWPYESFALRDRIAGDLAAGRIPVVDERMTLRPKRQAALQAFFASCLIPAGSCPGHAST